MQYATVSVKAIETLIKIAKNIVAYVLAYIAHCLDIHFRIWVMGADDVVTSAADVSC